MKKRKCSWRKARERTTMDQTCDTPDDRTYLGAQRCLQIALGLGIESSQAHWVRNCAAQMCLVSGCLVHT